MFAAGAVVLAFFLCWAPFHSQRLLYLYGQDLPHFAEINAWLYYVTGCLYFFGSTVNPILYNLMSVKYRMAFKETLCGGLSSREQGRGFREQSSFRETSVHQVGENGNGFKWQRSNGPAHGHSSLRHPRHGRYPGHGHGQDHGQGLCHKGLALDHTATQTTLVQNSVLEPQWEDGVATLDSALPADSEAEGAGDSGHTSEEAGSELVVMISPAHRKPKVYAVGKASRKWPKVLLKVARKNPSRTTAPSPTAQAAPEHGDTCI